MRTIRHALAIAGASAAAGVLAASSAIAAPVNVPDAEVITANCPGGQVDIVVAPGNGAFTPGFEVGTHRVFLPYRLVFTVRDAGGNVVANETEAKPAAVPAGAITCTFTETFTENGQTLTVTGTVTGVIRGKR